MEKLDEEVTKLANRLGLRKDYATVLLADNDWDGKLVVDNWNLPESPLITKAGIVTNPLLETKLVPYRKRMLVNMGVFTFYAKKCTKDYVEPLIRAGLTNVRCPVYNCHKTMASSAFLVDVSGDAKERFDFYLLEKFNIAQARHDYRGNCYGFHRIPSKFHHLFNIVQGFLNHLWSNMMMFGMYFLVCVLICRIIDGGSFQCTSILTAITLLPSLAMIAKAIVIVLLVKLILSDQIIGTAVLSSVATVVLMFLGIFARIRWIVHLVLRASPALFCKME